VRNSALPASWDAYRQELVVRSPEGNREFARILALCLTYPTEQVAAALDLAASRAIYSADAVRQLLGWAAAATQPAAPLDPARYPAYQQPAALPNLAALGLGEVVGLALGRPRPGATYGRLLERGAGKDTTTGHWELLGLALERPFPTYPDGFPAEVIEPFARAIGRGVLGNRPASGTAVIAELGDEHRRTGRPIVYTSADSVFQVACHEDVVPVAQLYEWCAIARRILSGRHAVGRVIARPFAGTSSTDRTPGSWR